jgi:ketosteroid isomerase-like protein
MSHTSTIRDWHGVSLLAATLALAIASPAIADPAPVIAAERAFSVRAAEVGMAASFMDFMAPDAIVFSPDVKLAREVYGNRPSKPPKDGGVLLAWWPTFAGMARSGDLGFTTGPAEVNGKRSVHYFTVWKKQADGAWKWVYDGGADSDPSHAPGASTPVTLMAEGDARPLAQATAFSQVQTAEARLARTAATDSQAAYRADLANDARVQGSPLPPATSPAAVTAELATRAKTIAFWPLGGEASKAGDLAWTYGDAKWADGRGHYVRVWRRGAGKWRIVFDQILPVAKP